MAKGSGRQEEPLKRLALPMCFLFVACHETRVLPFPFFHRKDLVGTICPASSDCEIPRKYLFTDLDGRTLGLSPPVSVFPRIEEGWTGSFFNTGQLHLTMMCGGKAEGMQKSWWPCCSMRTKCIRQDLTSKTASMCWCVMCVVGILSHWDSGMPLLWHLWILVSMLVSLNIENYLHTLLSLVYCSFYLEITHGTMNLSFLFC